jgi:L-threonylcarbamoyladenylate synthase
MARWLRAEDPEALALAAERLRAGEVVAFPTDTVYGIGARAFDGAAVAQLYVVKQRPPEKSIPVLLADLADLTLVAREWNDAAEALARAFWPGGLTLVVPRRLELPVEVSADDTVAVRLPDHAVTRALIRAAGTPVAATSANRSGEPSALTAGEVAAALGARLGWILDGGTAPGGVASTVVDCTADPPRVLRAGALAAETLRRAWPALAS